MPNGIDLESALKKLEQLRRGREPFLEKIADQTIEDDRRLQPYTYQWELGKYETPEIPPAGRRIFLEEEGIDVLVKPDYSVWLEGIPQGEVSPETGEFTAYTEKEIKEHLPLFERVKYEALPWLAKGAKALEYALTPFSTIGQIILSPSIREESKERIIPNYRELKADVDAGRITRPEYNAEIRKYNIPLLKEMMPGGLLYEEYRDKPIWQQLLAELPAWATLVGVSAIALRAALASSAARPGLAGVLPTAARAALAPAAGVEIATGAVLRYGIIIPITKGIPAGSRKLLQVALDQGLDRWIATQGRLHPEFRPMWQNWILTNRSWLIEKATNNMLRRQAERKGVQYAANKAAGDTVKEAESLLLKAAKDIGVKPVIPKVAPALSKFVTRKVEIAKLLATPAKELPKGIQKIALREELTGINAKLVPAEKKLRQQIMATVKTIGLPESQYRKLFSSQGGSKWLSQITIERLPRILESVRTARPVSIKGKKVITLKTEQDVLARKAELIDEGILTEETYKDILKAFKLKTDKYVSKELFITQSEARSILKEMNNRAILAPLGELKFGKPTPLSLLTSDVYYGQVLGVHPLVEPLELAKVDFDLAHRAMVNAIAKQINTVNKAFGVSVAEKLSAKIEGRPTKGVAKLRDLLDKFEEAPAELTKQQKAVFNWFRNLNRTIINGENEVRRGLGLPEIGYREAYVRHIPDVMAEEILRGLHPLPPSLEYWSRRIVSKKIFNPMEFHRQLSDDLAKLYTKDLAQATRNMVYTGLKEIHLAQPLKAFTERMGALQDVMPASTRKWVVDFVNQRIKGQQTEWDAGINRIVTESGFGGLMNDILRPYQLSLGGRPVTRFAETIGRGTILAVLGLPRPRLLRLLVRNLFQRTQELALHNPIAVIKGFVFEKGKLKELLDKSRFLKGYTGIEDFPVDLMGKLERIALAPYQTTAVINARQAMRTTYHDILPFFTKLKHKDLGWASPKRTYTEPKGFLYPEEETLMLAEMELAARATQYQYIGLGMPGIFRNKTLIPLTRLQSWWMNHFFVFHREAAHRFLYGATRLGHKLPWTKRVNYLIYLLYGGAILTSMGYGMSYLWKVIPHYLSPVGQLMTGLLTYVAASSDWEREKGKREIYSSWKAIVPGPLAWEEFQKLWSGEMPLWQMFFYGREEEGPPPRPPTWGIINRQPAIDKETAQRDIGEAIGLLGQTVPKEMPDPYHYIDEATGEYRLYTYPEEEYVYTTTDLASAIGRATLRLEDKDITEENEFSALTLFYKKAETLWGHYYYSLPASERPDFRESPEGAYVEACLFFWGKLSVLRNDESLAVVQKFMEEYNIPDNAIPSLAKETEKKPEEIDVEALERARGKLGIP